MSLRNQNQLTDLSYLNKDMFYKKLSLYLSENQNISKDDEELYEYAAKVIIHGIINIVITILIGIFFGMLKECVCLFITFFILRKFTGGLHAKKYIYCFISSIVLIILSLFIIRYLEQNSKQLLFICILVFSAILIWLFSPIENSNKVLSLKEKKVFKYISSFLTLVILLVVLFCLNNNISIAYSFGLGEIITAFLLIISLLKKYIERILKYCKE